VVFLFVPLNFLSEAVFKFSVFFVGVFDFFSFAVNEQSQPVDFGLELFNVGFEEAGEVLNFEFGEFL
jgi:hypothetical protein